MVSKVCGNDPIWPISKDHFYDAYTADNCQVVHARQCRAMQCGATQFRSKLSRQRPCQVANPPVGSSGKEIKSMPPHQLDNSERQTDKNTVTRHANSQWNLCVLRENNIIPSEKSNQTTHDIPNTAIKIRKGWLMHIPIGWTVPLPSSGKWRYHPGGDYYSEGGQVNI